MAFGKKKSAAHKVNVYRLRPTTAQRAVLRDLGDRVSALWNAANYRCRQNYLAKLGVPGYAELCSTLLSDSNYRRSPSDIAQEVLAKLTDTWSSYFTLLERHHNKEVPDKPGLPKYRKNKDGRPSNLILIKNPRSYELRRTPSTCPCQPTCGHPPVAYRSIIVGYVAGTAVMAVRKSCAIRRLESGICIKRSNCWSHRYETGRRPPAWIWA